MDIIKEILFGNGDAVYALAPLVVSLISTVAGELLKSEPEKDYSLGNLTGEQYTGMQVNQQQSQGGMSSSTIGSLFDMLNKSGGTTATGGTKSVSGVDFGVENFDYSSLMSK